MGINEAKKQNRRFVVYNYEKHPMYTDQITTLQIMEKFDKSSLRPMEYQEALYR